MSFRVRRLAVMSSPSLPSPRVAPCTKTPSSYRSEADKPSILGSATKASSSSVLQPEEAAHARHEIDHVLIAEGIVQRQHRHAMDHLGEFLAGLGADAVAGTVGAHEIREARLDGGIAPAQRVVFGVADGRRIVQIIAPVMGGDLAGQRCELPCRFGARKLLRPAFWRRPSCALALLLRRQTAPRSAGGARRRALLP